MGNSSQESLCAWQTQKFNLETTRTEGQITHQKNWKRITKQTSRRRVTPPLVTRLVDNGASIEEALTSIVDSIGVQNEQMSLRMSELERAVQVEREYLSEDINRSRQEVRSQQKRKTLGVKDGWILGRRLFAIEEGSWVIERLYGDMTERL